MFQNVECANNKTWRYEKCHLALSIWYAITSRFMSYTEVAVLCHVFRLIFKSNWQHYSFCKFNHKLYLEYKAYYKMMRIILGGYLFACLISDVNISIFVKVLCYIREQLLSIQRVLSYIRWTNFHIQGFLSYAWEQLSDITSVLYPIETHALLRKTLISKNNSIFFSSQIVFSSRNFLKKKKKKNMITPVFAQKNNNKKIITFSLFFIYFLNRKFTSTNRSRLFLFCFIFS